MRSEFTNLASTSKIDGDTLIFFAIGKEEVDSKNFDRAIAQLKAFREAGEVGLGTLQLTFQGYDKDKREIYEIPEIRDYMSMLYHMFPELFSFLLPDETVVYPILFCVLDIEIVGVRGNRKQVGIKKTLRNNLIMKLALGYCPF